MRGSKQTMDFYNKHSDNGKSCMTSYQHLSDLVSICYISFRLKLSHSLQRFHRRDTIATDYLRAKCPCIDDRCNSRAIKILTTVPIGCFCAGVVSSTASSMTRFRKMSNPRSMPLTLRPPCRLMNSFLSMNCRHDVTIRVQRGTITAFVTFFNSG